MTLTLPGVIIGNWQDNEVMTAVEPLQHKGRDGPSPQYGQYSYLTPTTVMIDWAQLRHTITFLWNPVRCISTSHLKDGIDFFFPHHTFSVCRPREAFILIKEKKDK